MFIFKKVSAPRLPAVLKIGHAHGGLGKLKVETALDFQDAASVVAVSNSYWYDLISSNLVLKDRQSS